MSLSPAVCGVNCHIRCQKNMPPLCGVNEKMLAEALKSVDELKRNRRLVRDYYVDTIRPLVYKSFERMHYVWGESLCSIRFVGVSKALAVQ